MGAVLHGHGLVMRGIEGLALRVDRLQLIALESVLEQPEGQLQAIAHRLDRLVIRTRQLEAALQTVDDRQQVIGKLFQGELVRLLYILLGATTHVLQVRRHAQSLILSGSQLFLQHLDASIQLIAHFHFGIGGKLWQLVIAGLFVSHAFLL
ncbi:hypothetical protein D3C86_1566060 [compost metagenome]